jgi:hypothetical protein
MPSWDQPPFNCGDTVICTGMSNEYFARLTVGVAYTVRRTEFIGSEDWWIDVENDPNGAGPYEARYFQLINGQTFVAGATYDSVLECVKEMIKSTPKKE